MKIFFVLLSAILAHSVYGDCSIKNDTKYDFTVTYGNVSNRSFGANHIENFPKGSISGTAGAKSFSASCSAVVCRAGEKSSAGVSPGR